ncbi:lytic transglycosylase domain-containing protein [Acidocella sp.]|uniref:lytic transglycosylase domain-containing protein n=1 Tax=Acidocella sp. TaxID=50710 RepID=UPI00260969CB|nr:lytic transglycosylase domain-containing protein [Acidocella sp.]MDD2794792.1 lytic transglycosylase domain-containing protein [Acidocella sp.]
MRGALNMLSRLNVTRLALVTVSVFALGLVVPTSAAAKSSDWGQGTGPMPPPSAPASATGGETVAYAVPRNAPSPDVEIVLPEPLPPSAVAMYQRILAAQSAGAFSEADRLISRLDDSTLVGPVLAQRYLSNNYITKPAELLAWYAQYSSQPEAPDIYALMRHKLRADQMPPAPVVALLPEATTTAGAAARPVAAPDSYSWHRQFMSGIQAWEKGDLSAAASAFDSSAAMAGISSDERAASQFWAARAALRMQQPEAYLNWLHQAAWSGDTFYGMLAGRLLGQGFGPTGIAATLTEADITAVDATPDGHLAFALLQIGADDQAAVALRALWPQIQANPALGRAVMAVAARAGLVDVTIAIASQLPNPVDEIAGARLPLPALHPDGGFTVDPALVYAVARTESGFNETAVSRCGARGLMQLMPVTASYVRRQEGVSGSLDDPSANLALGQGYIRYLGAQPGIKGNLLAILASYNAGPNAVAGWTSQDEGDPLLFIETIPNDETRRFVRQVMADSWLYAEEIGLKPESLDQLAEGDFPTLNQNFYTASAN